MYFKVDTHQKVHFSILFQEDTLYVELLFWGFFGHLGNSPVHHKDLFGAPGK